MSDGDAEHALETVEVGIPDEEFMDELMSGTDAETLDDLVTRLVDYSVRTTEEALDHEPQRTQEIEVPVDTAMRFQELMNRQGEEIDDIGTFMTYTLTAQYINQVSNFRL